MTPDVLEIVKHWLFGQSVVIMYQTAVINKRFDRYLLYLVFRLTTVAF